MKLVSSQPSIPHASALPELRQHWQRLLTTYNLTSTSPIAVLALRNKGSQSNCTDAIRSCPDQSTYIQTIDYLIDRGYFVVGLAESRSDLVSSKRYTCVSSVASRLNIPKKLADVLMLTSCHLYIGQQSGPQIIPECRVCTVIICDNVFPSYGGNNSSSLIVNRPITVHSRMIPAEELYSFHADLCFGINYDFHNARFAELSSGQILAAVTNVLEDNASHYVRFPYPRFSRIYYSDNRVFDLSLSN